MELLKELENFKNEANCYESWDGKTCYRQFGSLAYYFLKCKEWGLVPKVEVAGLSYLANSELIEFDYCEGDLILYVKKIYIKSLFSGWRQVDELQAQRWASHFINDASNRQKAVEIVPRRLIGSTIEKLKVRA